MLYALCLKNTNFAVTKNGFKKSMHIARYAYIVDAYIAGSL
jgi:hypothetical protein